MLDLSELKDILSWEDLCSLLNSSYKINSTLDPKILVNSIIEECMKVVNCKECNLYIYDFLNDVFYHGFDTSSYTLSNKLLKKVFANNRHELLNDSNYNLVHDLHSSTKSSSNALYLPLFSQEKGVVIAIIEIIDKYIKDEMGNIKNENFTDIDIIRLKYLAKISSISIVNCEKYKEVLNTKEKADNLLNLVQSLRVDLGLQSNLFTLCIHAQEIIESEHCIALIGIPEKQQIISLISDVGSEILFNYEIGDTIHKIIETKHSLIIQNIGDDDNPNFENSFIEYSTNYYRIGSCSTLFLNNNDDQIIRLLQKVYGGEKPIYNALIFPIYAEKDNWSCLPTPSQRISSISSLSSVFSSFEIGYEIDELSSFSPRNNSLLNSSMINSNNVVPGSPKSDRVGRTNIPGQAHSNTRSSSLSPSTQYIQNNMQAIALIVLINRLGVFKEKSKFTENDVKLLEPFGRIVAPNIGTIFQTSLFSYLQTLYNTDRSICFNKYQDKMPQDPPSFVYPHSNRKNRHSDIIFEEDEDVVKDLDK